MKPEVRINELWLRAAVWLVLAGLLPAQAQEASKDVLYLSGRFDSVSGTRGGGGGIEWHHTFASGSGFNLGVFSFDLGENRWAYGSLGGHFRHGSNTTTYFQVQLGSGWQPTKTTAYRIYRVGITRSIIQKRLYVELEDQYFHVGETKENLVKTGVIIYPSSAMRGQVDAYFSTAGDPDSRLVSAKFNVDARPVKYLAGLSVGRTVPERFLLTSSSAGSLRSNQFFGGVLIPVRKYELGIVFDTVRVSRTTKRTVSLTWKLPLD